ncbi:hypothetical protein QP027_04480 [Corynebacterium breve]|uniref:Peptidase A2 domain-containing protein n=1 Tax=Corynebacterium breve TaxID=3049799 RepID=A0ABY8VH44_9CORY|nr:hypothetical protein [Corynebacterium breve]WIM68652.1 hypothetical protein QP027_04480 [Corynebacterium breve]
MTTSPDLTIGIGWESVSDDSVDWKEVRSRLDEANASGVTVSVGRADFIGFPVKGQEDRWASGVSEKDDIVDDVITSLTKGTDRRVVLTIDTMAPRIVETNPKYEGVFASGEKAEDFPSATALYEGEVGEGVEKLCAATQERYSPDAIALTELIGDTFFSAADEELFKEMTGEKEFPRDDKGDIDTSDDILNDWQSEIITSVITRCQEASGGSVVMDARVNWDAPGENRFDSGHRYDDILDTGADLTLWTYTSLAQKDPQAIEEIAAGLKDRFGDEAAERFTLSVGLWGDISPKELTQSVDSAEGFPVSVTPLSLMTDKHWDALSN